MSRWMTWGWTMALGTLLACSGESSDSGSSDGGADEGGEGSGEGGEGSGEGGEGGEGGDTDAIEISSFSVTECVLDTGMIPQGDEALSASVTDGSIHVEHLAVTGNCCPTGWDMGVTVEESQLNVWYYGDGDCDCECLYDLNYEITGTTSGTWTVNAGGASVEVVMP